jgi:hypothetical protein
MALTEMSSSSPGKAKRLNLTPENPETSRRRPCSRPCLFTVSVAKARSATPGTRAHSSKWPENHSEEGPSCTLDSQRPSEVIRRSFRGSHLSKGFCISPQIPDQIVYHVLDGSYHLELFLDNGKTDFGLHCSEPIQGVDAVHPKIFKQVGLRTNLLRRNFKLCDQIFRDPFEYFVFSHSSHHGCPSYDSRISYLV